MVDVGVGKVPLGAAKPPSRRDGGIGPTGPPFNRGEELTVPSHASPALEKLQMIALESMHLSV